MSEKRYFSGITFLKRVMLVSGAYDLIIGLVMIFFIAGLFYFLGLGSDKNVSPLIFARTAVLAIGFGALLIAASRDPARYIIIPLASIALRLLIQVPFLAGLRVLSELTWPLLGFGAVDLFFAFLTGLAIYRSGINWRKF